MSIYGNLEEKTNAELRNICQNLGLTGYSKKNKATLIGMIQEATGTVDSAPSPDNGGMAIITCGLNRGPVACVGMTVSEVAATCKESFNIPDNANILASGKKVSGSYVIKPGDNVEFIKPAGTKG